MNLKSDFCLYFETDRVRQSIKEIPSHIGLCFLVKGPEPELVFKKTNTHHVE